MLTNEDMRNLIEADWLNDDTQAHIAAALCPYENHGDPRRVAWMEGFNERTYIQLEKPTNADPDYVEGWEACNRCLTVEPAESFETETVAVVDIHHISEADLVLLHEMVERSPSAIRKEPLLKCLDSHYGVYVYTAMDRAGELDMTLDEAVSQGLTAEAVAIIKGVAKEGFTWVRFCKDGPQYEEYRTFDWG